jgi:ISXO2 transposase-like protein/transposase-like zinc ribbon protein
MEPLGFPSSLPQFQKFFPDDAACAKYLEAVRWPEGFVCPFCAHQGEPWRMARSKAVLRCPACRKDAFLTAGTVMQDTRTPLSTWFWGAYLMTTQTPGISSVQFQRQLGLKRNETAFTMLHKLRAGMVRPDRDKIGDEWAVEVDECYIGGATRGQGKGVHHKALVVAAVEVRMKQPPEDPVARKKWMKLPSREKIYAGRLRLQVVPDHRMDMLTEFVTENVAPKAKIMSDGWQGYNELMKLGYKHKPLVMAGDPQNAEDHLPLIHVVISNLKTWILGTHHGRIEVQHLQAYLNEFVFRFNRRFYPMNSFNSVLGLAVKSASPTYEQLYSGAWEHPGGCPNIDFS